MGACVAGGEMPVHLPLVGVGGVLPCGEFGIEDVEVVDASAQALPGERGELDLCDVEPGAVFRGVMDLESLREGPGFGRRERLVEGAEGVRVEVVHDQHDFRRIGVVDAEEAIDFVCPVHAGAAGSGVNVSMPRQRLDPDEDGAGSVADILRVLLTIGPGSGGDRVPCVCQELVWLLVHADYRPTGVVVGGIDLKDILHPGHKLATCRRWDRPTLLQVRAQPPFLRTRPIVE